LQFKNSFANLTLIEKQNTSARQESVKDKEEDKEGGNEEGKEEAEDLTAGQLTLLIFCLTPLCLLFICVVVRETRTKIQRFFGAYRFLTR
jgi:hypothetical protein